MLVPLACQPDLHARHWRPVPSIDSVIPRRIRDGIQHARIVQAVLVDPKIVPPGDSTAIVGDRLGGLYRPRSAWTRLSHAQADRLEKVLLDRRSWQPDEKTCLFV